MTHRHQRHPPPLRRLVHLPFDLECHGRGAFVQDGVAGRVVEEARHGEALLDADAKDVGPVFRTIPAGGAIEQVGDVDYVEEGEEVGVGDVLGVHFP